MITRPRSYVGSRVALIDIISLLTSYLCPIELALSPTTSPNCCKPLLSEKHQKKSVPEPCFVWSFETLLHQRLYCFFPCVPRTNWFFNRCIIFICDLSCIQFVEHLTFYPKIALCIPGIVKSVQFRTLWKLVKQLIWNNRRFCFIYLQSSSLSFVYFYATFR